MNVEMLLKMGAFISIGFLLGINLGINLNNNLIELSDEYIKALEKLNESLEKRYHVEVEYREVLNQHMNFYKKAYEDTIKHHIKTLQTFNSKGRDINE